MKNILSLIKNKLKVFWLSMFYWQYLSFKKSKSKQIIVVFDGKVKHGGFVDRLKGMITMYEASMVTNAQFFIHFTNPFVLEELFEPNQVQWNLSKNELQWNPFNSKILVKYNDFHWNPVQTINESSCSLFFVYLNLDLLKTMHPELTNQETETLWATHFNCLFKPSIILQNSISSIKSNKYNVFHTRFTSLLGDFKDTTSTLLTLTQREVLCDKLKLNMLEISKNSNLPWYVFSDSYYFLQYIKENTPFKILEGKPHHMDGFDKNANVQLKNHLKTALDFMIISQAEQVIFLKEESMYESSFARYASFLGKNTFEIKHIS